MDAWNRWHFMGGLWIGNPDWCVMWWSEMAGGWGCSGYCSLLRTGPQFNIKLSSYQYRKSHCGDKTVVRSSYLHNGISYTGKMTSLYWIRAQVLGSHSLNMEFETKWPPFCRWHIHTHFLVWKSYFDSNFTEICSKGWNYQCSRIGSDNGSIHIRQQAIIWPNDGLLYWYIYVSLGLNEFTFYMLNCIGRKYEYVFPFCIHTVNMHYNPVLYNMILLTTQHSNNKDNTNYTPYLALMGELWGANFQYCQISNIIHTLVGNRIVDHSDVVGASPVGAAPTTSLFTT